MSPLNRGPLLGPRMPPVGMRPPPPRFGGRLPIPGIPPRMPPPIGPMFGPMRQRMMPPRPGPMMRPGGPLPLFGPRGRGVPPLMPPLMGPRVMGPRGPIMRPGPRGIMPPQGLSHMRPRFPIGNGNIKMKAMNNAKKVSKLEELEMKKPWMTDEIRNEIQKKNKLYAKAKKNKDAKEWEEFKDLRNKVTRMIRDAKNEYLAKNPEQAQKYEDDNEAYDQRDENYVSSEDNEDNTSNYCEVCDREFETRELLQRHKETHKTCGIDGCIFSAHPKLVEKHISMQHCTGLYHRMKNLSTPEDVQKWISERKKKYPTKSNVERKQAEQMEKRRRGEIIEKQKIARNPNNLGCDKKRKVRKRRRREPQAKPELPSELYRGLRPFAGIANLPEIVDEPEAEESKIVNKIKEVEFLPDECNNISDEDEPNILETDTAARRSLKVPLQLSEICSKRENQSALGSLIANYGSDSEEEEAPEEVPIKRVKEDVPLENESVRASKESLIEIVDEQRTIIRETAALESNSTTNSRTPKNWDKPSIEKRFNNNRKTIDGRHYSPKCLMLLQRLLSRSIQHERNIICQCIKYIADNNFFSE